ncbi:MAG: hypothetical protein F6K55_41195 [Moorea sp. SIO4A3]|nr:hypothetical protein [Moorena sp. SIO4A3]
MLQPCLPRGGLGGIGASEQVRVWGVTLNFLSPIPDSRLPTPDSRLPNPLTTAKLEPLLSLTYPNPNP